CGISGGPHRGSCRRLTMQIEQHTIHPIAADARHGRARDLFTVWFGSNVMLLTVITGALAVTVFRLPLGWAVGGLLVGNLVGGLMMALHAAQGPTLGVPQMVQTRGQFGARGALFVVAIVIIMYDGFFASNLVLGAETLRVIAPGMSEIVAIVLLGVLSVIATILGYDVIHGYTRLMTYVSGAILLLTFAWILFVHGVPADLFTRNAGAGAPRILGAVSVAALWQIAYAPYVSDYSRYMPAETGVRPAFWATYWGCCLGSILPMTLGVIVALVAGQNEIIPTLATLTRGITALVFVVFSVAMIANNAMNVYCGALSSLLFGYTLQPSWHPQARARTLVSLMLLVIALALALLGRNSFLESYTSFILLLLYVLTPWTAINLVDYYLIRRARYDVSSFMRADGGIYGRYNGKALFCYALGILVQIPFVSNPLYKGVVARALHEADLSWIVGLIVTATTYYFMARAAQVTAPARNVPNPVV
ncbi:MAG TPA: cytosine permease, partial [Ktedonobacterales bacterium]|nr:cytosine permease [Ktedonobacterales bacterium]